VATSRSQCGSLLKILIGPALVVAVTMSTMLMFVQRRQHGGITTAQGGLQVVLWIVLFVFGLTFPARAEKSGGASILVRLIGQGPLTSALSGLLWTASAFVAWGVGIALLALLIIGLDSKRHGFRRGRRRSPYQPPSNARSPVI
jgi:hypothetical protein